MNDYVLVDGMPVEKGDNYLCPFCLEYFNRKSWGKHIKKCRKKSVTKDEVQRRYNYIREIVSQE